MTSIPLTQAQACLEAIKQYFTTPDGKECSDKMNEAQMLCKALVDTLSKQGDEKLRIKELEIFIEQVYEAVRRKRIEDLDTNWRMVEQVMPLNLECLHSKDAAEISGSYRKIHLSDIISAAREMSNLYKTQQPTAIAEQREELRSIRESLIVARKSQGFGETLSNHLNGVESIYTTSIALIDRMISDSSEK